MVIGVPLFVVHGATMNARYTHSWSASAALALGIALLVGCGGSPELKAKKFLRSGDEYFTKKDYSRALLQYQNASKLTPKDAEPHYRIGLAYLERGEAQNALREFQRALTADPKHRGAQLKIAEFLAISPDKNLVSEAVSRVAEAFGESPDDPEALDVLAVAKWNLGRREDAAEHLAEALKKFPTHLQSSVTLARLKLSSGDPAAAEEVLKKATADAPHSAAAALALGELYLLVAKPLEAEPVFKRALQIDGNNATALKALGMIQIATKRLDEADSTYRRLAALPGPENKRAHAVFLYQLGKRDDGIAELESLYKSDPKNRELRNPLVAAYIATNRTAAAEAVIATALKQNPKDADALVQRAELHLRSRRPDDAINDLNAAARFVPDSAVAHVLLARAYSAKGLSNNEVQELQRALELNPGLISARLSLERRFLVTNHGKAALSVIDAAPNRQKNTPIWASARIWALLGAGYLEDARKAIDQRLQQGRPSDALYQSAVLRFARQDYAGARRDLDELLQRGLVEPNVLAVMMRCYAAQKQLPQGVTRLKEIVAAHPSAPRHNLLGEWYYRAQRTDDARAEFQLALQADPQLTAAKLFLAEIDIAAGRTAEAREALKGAMGAGGTQTDNLGALLLYARALEGSPAEQIAAYRKVLELDDSNVMALNNLAYTLAVERPDEALQLAQKAAELAPDDPHVQDTLALAHYRKGQYSAALQYLKRAVGRPTATPQQQFHLGMAYIKAGETTRGQQLVNDALRKNAALANTEQEWIN